jgi:hypothetical protein
VPEVRGRLLAVVVGSGGRTSLAIRVAAAQARAGLVETITRGWSTASRMPPFEADEGTRTLDLLHGKRSQRSVFMPGIAAFPGAPGEACVAFMALRYPSIPCVLAAGAALAAETGRRLQPENDSRCEIQPPSTSSPRRRWSIFSHGPWWMPTTDEALVSMGRHRRFDDYCWANQYPLGKRRGGWVRLPRNGTRVRPFRCAFPWTGEGIVARRR